MLLINNCVCWWHLFFGISLRFIDYIKNSGTIIHEYAENGLFFYMTMQFKLFLYPVYSPDLLPSDYHPFSQKTYYFRAIYWRVFSKRNLERQNLWKFVSWIFLLIIKIVFHCRLVPASVKELVDLSRWVLTVISDTFIFLTHTFFEYFLFEINEFMKIWFWRFKLFNLLLVSKVIGVPFCVRGAKVFQMSSYLVFYVCYFRNH